MHLCIDMQQMYLSDTPWHAPWMARVLPAVEEIAARHAADTIFTRFIPPQKPQDAVGAWVSYYERWEVMTRSRLDPDELMLAKPLRRLVPPATILDKSVYSPWLGTDLHAFLRSRQVKGLVITGGETDVCVMAAIIGAIDLGYRVVLPVDAIYGSADQTHDAMMEIYRDRFSQQLLVCTTEELLDDWPDQ